MGECFALLRLGVRLPVPPVIPRVDAVAGRPFSARPSRQKVLGMPLDLVPTLSDLIAIPSVNPMGRDVEGPEYLEYRVTDYLEKL